jgi:hypothetical protein
MGDPLAIVKGKSCGSRRGGLEFCRDSYVDLDADADADADAAADDYVYVLGSSDWP